MTPSSAVAQDSSALGTGVYEVTAGPFGTWEDGLIGRPTSSGYLLREGNRLVGLPACTVSSCPWLPPGTGADAASGPQTSCAEGDGLCWVELTNDATGACVTAPVLDLGPFFVRDNWWEAPNQRTYSLPSGVPAAALAAQGHDVGFGPGRSDDGFDVTAWADPPALSVAAGTWADLGLDPSAQSAPLRVRLLWQSGLLRADACDGGTAPPQNATTAADLAVWEKADAAGEPFAVVPAGRRISVTGSHSNGLAPIAHGGRHGFADPALLVPDEAASPALFAADAINLRAGPSPDDPVLTVLPTGTALTTTGLAVDGFLPVSWDGLDGWVATSYLVGTAP